MDQSEWNKELGEVSAYPTKQKAGQKDVWLLENDRKPADRQDVSQEKGRQE